MQYIVCCLCFSIAKPFRKPIWTNPLFLVSVIAMAVFQLYLILYQDKFDAELWGLTAIPKSYKYELLYLVIANTLASYLFEKVFIGWFSRYYNARE